MSETLNLADFSVFFRQGTSIVANVVNLVRPTIVASLSHWAPTFVDNNMGVVQRVARIRQRQLILIVTLRYIKLSLCQLSSAPKCIVSYRIYLFTYLFIH